MFEAVGHPVQRLRRLSYGGVFLGRLPVGQLRPLTDAEIGELSRASAGGSERPQRRRRASS
jgi:23S rRNA pseudouridine2605 synthase